MRNHGLEPAPTNPSPFLHTGKGSLGVGEVVGHVAARVAGGVQGLKLGCPQLVAVPLSQGHVDAGDAVPVGRGAHHRGAVALFEFQVSPRVVPVMVGVDDVRQLEVPASRRCTHVCAMCVIGARMRCWGTPTSPKHSSLTQSSPTVPSAPLQQGRPRKGPRWPPCWWTAPPAATLHVRAMPTNSINAWPDIARIVCSQKNRIHHAHKIRECCSN